MLHNLFACHNPTEGNGPVNGNSSLYILVIIPRLIAIFMTGQHDRGGLFEVVHAFWGQVFTIFLVLMSFILWLKSLDNGRVEKGHFR